MPGTIVLMGLGALVPTTGAIGLLELMAYALAGALVGDGLSYALGRRYHGRLRELPAVRRRAHLIEQGEAFFRRHGGVGIVLGRLFQGTRAVVPMIAGMADMPLHRFLIADLIAALIWVPTTILPGVLFGASLQLAAAVSMRLAVILVAFTAALLLIVLLLRLMWRRGIPLALRLGARLLERARTGGRWPGRLLRLVAERWPSGAWVVGVLGGTAALALWAFVIVLEDVVRGEPLVRIDSAVFNLLLALRTSLADWVLVALAGLGDGVVVAAVFLAVLAVLVGRRAWWAAGHWSAAALGTALFAAVTQALLHRPRPVLIEDGVGALAFLTGHVASNAVLWGLLVLLALPELRRVAARAVTAAAVLLVTAIAFARIYLGAHWLSDALAGLSFALAWVAIVGAFYFGGRRYRRIGARSLLAVAALALLVVGASHLAARHDEALERYAVRPEPHLLETAAWRDQGWRMLAAARIDMAGTVEEPLVLQWAGEPAALRQTLEAAGWEPPPPWSLAGALAFLYPAVEAADLPVVAKLHDGHLPELTLIRALEADARLVLRLWPAGAEIGAEDETTLALWLGGVSLERLRRLPWLLTWTETVQVAPIAGIEALVEALDARPRAGELGPVLLVGNRALSPGG